MDSDDRKEISKKRIVEAARIIITDTGVNNVTIEGISKASGVAKTTIYRHWDGVDDIILEVFSGMSSHPENYDTGTVVADLQKYALYTVKCFEKEDWARCMPDILERSKNNEVFREKKKTLMAKNTAPVLDAIQRGIERKELASGTNAELLLNQILGPIFMVYMVQSGTMTKSSINDLVTNVVRSYSA